jgi:dihydropteroate synthase
LAFSRKPFKFAAGRALFSLGVETKIMGVLNVTPDSFSDGGAALDPGRAEVAAIRMRDEGAHFLDIGGESSRPGARPVSWREETRRILPVLKRLVRRVGIPISVDTHKYEVAWAALDEGVCIINDIRALASGKKLARLIARKKASVVLMHMRGTPRTMQKNPRYRNVVQEVMGCLKRSACRARDAGIERSRILIDPGFGFGKTIEHNFELLSHLDQFARLGYPVLVGLSRKSFLGSPLILPVGQRLYASLAGASCAIERGAHVLRVHEVLPHRQAAAITDCLLASYRDQP